MTDLETRMREALARMDESEQQGDRRAATMWWMQFVKLHGQRSPETVMRMERQQRLNPATARPLESSRMPAVLRADGGR